MHASATDLNKHSGKYLHQAIKEPVIIEKSGQPVVVMVSYEHYMKLEDAYWGARAVISDQDQSLDVNASLTFLKSDD